MLTRTILWAVAAMLLAAGAVQADANNANYYNGGFTDPTNLLTVVGAFAGSPGPYGAYDVGGDVWQWNEANIIFDENSVRGTRGGVFSGYGAYLQAARWVYEYPAGASDGIGFRVSEVPEPASMTLLAPGGLALLRRRKAV